jgi:hypothetical protein
VGVALALGGYFSCFCLMYKACTGLTDRFLDGFYLQKSTSSNLCKEMKRLYVEILV